MATSMIEVETTPINGLLVLRPKVFSDDRGDFQEVFNQRNIAQALGRDLSFVQDNESRSRAGVLRGLHLQTAPHAQAKLVRVVQGAVLDVCVDLREDSPTFGRHYAIRLDEDDRSLLFIPEGFAHGFLSLKDDTRFQYKCSTYRDAASERTILWNDPELGIDWGITDPVLSDKDRQGDRLMAGTWKV